MILLTAFKGNNNASKILLDRIGGENITKTLLTNSYEACERELLEAISSCNPDYIISFGRKPVINRLYIETTAQKNGSSINTNFDILLLEESLKEHGLPFRISTSPGNYLCNHVYYHGLNYIEKNRAETKMIFIHVPDVKRFQNINTVVSWLNDFCSKNE